MALGVATIALVLAHVLPALPQARQPFPEDAVRQLIKAALLQYFDPASVFEIALSGTTLSGEILVIETLLIEGTPAVLRGFRGEVVAQFSDLQLDMANLINQQLKAARVGKASLVARSTARDVQEALTRVSGNILGPIVKFQTGQFEIAATIKRREQLYPAQARGNLLVEQGQRVRIVITQAQVFGSDVPLGLIESELAKLNPVLDLSKWPVDVRIQRLVLHNDRIELLATGGR